MRTTRRIYKVRLVEWVYYLYVCVYYLYVPIVYIPSDESTRYVW